MTHRRGAVAVALLLSLSATAIARQSAAPDARVDAVFSRDGTPR
jgi:hypothetical protein